MAIAYEDGSSPKRARRTRAQDVRLSLQSGHSRRRLGAPITVRWRWKLLVGEEDAPACQTPVAHH